LIKEAMLEFSALARLVTTWRKDSRPYSTSICRGMKFGRIVGSMYKTKSAESRVFLHLIRTCLAVEHASLNTSRNAVGCGASRTIGRVWKPRLRSAWNLLTRRDGRLECRLSRVVLIPRSSRWRRYLKHIGCRLLPISGSISNAVCTRPIRVGGRASGRRFDKHP